MSFDLDPCRVFAATGELVAEGFVREHDSRSLLVEAEHFSGAWLDQGDPVVVQVMSSLRGECTYDAVVQASELHRIEMVGLTLREAVQKRAAARVTTSLPFRITHRVEGDELVVLPEPLDVTVLDVSAYGMRLGCAEEIEADTRLVLDFRAEGVSRRLVLRVLRAGALPSGFAHGCVIEGLDERQTDDLFGFVLSEQRRQRAARMDAV